LNASPDSSLALKALAALFVGAFLALALFVAVIGGAASGGQSIGLDVSIAGLALQDSQACAVSGPVAGLDRSQAAYAGQVVSAAFADSGENPTVARIALMVADTESGLRDLGPLPGNAGSLGLFQQRASQGWGTAPEEMNPVDATDMFVRRLLAVPGWSSFPSWVAAQDVQHSAFTGHPSASNGGSSVVGGSYEAHWALSGQLLSSVLANGNTAGGCGQGPPGGVIGPASAHGLPPGYAVPAGTGPLHARVVAFALGQLGKPYVWGAAGPGAFDCSGFTMAAWAAVGVHLLHYTVDQQHEGQAASTTGLMAGDLVLVPGSDSPGPGLAGHVGIYLGDGMVISAIDPQMGVAVQSWQTFISGGLLALRNPDPTDA
jgi:cell wall-associated NlpC family hydrolase